jgi:hypothetical protein
MFPESKFAMILASIATIFVICLITLFSTYVLLKQDNKSAGFNIFKATGSGNQFKGLNNAVSR